MAGKQSMVSQLAIPCNTAAADVNHIELVFLYCVNQGIKGGPPTETEGGGGGGPGPPLR